MKVVKRVGILCIVMGLVTSLALANDNILDEKKASEDVKAESVEKPRETTDITEKKEVNESIEVKPLVLISKQYDGKAIYEEMKLEGVINKKAFFNAVKGYNRVPKKTSTLLTIIDYSKSSKQERFYVVDLETKKLITKSYVSHGWKTGDEYARKFSNKVNSNMSSKGIFLTGNTYLGENGISLNLHGLEKGRNDKAFERRIVIHGAEYAKPESIQENGFLGRSSGCPALPEDIAQETIDLIKGGTVLYIFG